MCAADDLLNFAAVCDERSLMIYIEVIEQVQAIVSVRGASGLAELITNLRMLGGQGEARRLLSLLDARFINHSSDRERGKGHSSDDQHRAVSSASVPRIGRLTSRTFQEHHRSPLAVFPFRRSGRFPAVHSDSGRFSCFAWNPSGGGPAQNPK